MADLLAPLVVGRIAASFETRVEQITARLHIGPLPPPDQLQLYKEVAPESIAWMRERADKEQDHRHEMEKDAAETVKSDMVKSHAHVARYTWLWFILAAVGIGGGVVLAATGEYVGAGIIGGAGAAVGGVGIFRRPKGLAPPAPSLPADADTGDTSEGA